MAYCTISDIEKSISTEELAVLTGDPTGNTVDTVMVDYSITAANAIIDLYIGNVYEIPVESPVPILISRFSADLAVVFLYEFAYRDSQLPLTINSARKNLFYMLENIRKGKLKIPGLEYKGGYIEVSKTQADRTITGDDLNLLR